jgi:hypothetical protein
LSLSALYLQLYRVAFNSRGSTTDYCIALSPQALRVGTSPDTNFDIQDYEDELNHLSAISEDDLVAELIGRSAQSPRAGPGPGTAVKANGNSDDKPYALTKIDCDAKAPSRPPSPSTPQYSSEDKGDNAAELCKKLATARGCFSITSGGVCKRSLNRRSRTQPVRAYLG